MKLLPALAIGLAFASAFPMETGSAAEKPAAEPHASAEKRRGPQFAFVCLKSDKKPDDAALKKSLAGWFSLRSVDDIKAEEPTSMNGKSVRPFIIEGRTYMIAQADFPIPKADISYACANSFFWPDAKAALEQQKGHLIVIVQGEFESPAHEGMALSRAIAACSECYDSLAVYWGHANTVQKPESFQNVIRQSGTAVEKLPVPAWVGFLRARNKDGGMDIYTSGLGAFGAMEIEVVGTTQKTSDILGKMTGLSAYLIASGNVIKDGDTIGGSENEKIKTRHAESVIGRKGKVLRVEF